MTAIITQLQSKRIVTATYLAKKHGVSVRTIYRDIRTLEKSGIPIITEEGKGYALMEGYQLPPVLFTEAEAHALITAERLMLHNTDESLREHFGSAMTKIKSVLQHSQKGKVELLSSRIYFGENHAFKRSSNHLMLLQSAIANFQLLEVEYLSLSEKLSKRLLEPFALYSTKGKWLLVAFCRKRDDFRVFRVDLIQKIVTQKVTFEPHQLTMEEYFEQYQKNS
ncbi:MAG: WYL domain-containing protein [Bacteroidota bacterium]